jgi:hypothetical protein
MLKSSMVDPQKNILYRGTRKPWTIPLFSKFQPLQISRWVSTHVSDSLVFLATDEDTVYRNSKQIFPEMKLRGLVPNSYIHSLTDKRMWKLGTRPHSSFLGIHKSDLLCSETYCKWSLVLLAIALATAAVSGWLINSKYRYSERN